MDILLGMVAIFLVVLFVALTYTFIQDVFNFVISPIINNRLDKHVSTLYQMGLYESADIVRLRFLRRWRDLL